MTLENIGENFDALLCMTDNTACCACAQVPGGGILGDWYFPNGTVVRNSGDGDDFYKNRGPSVVRMHRRRDGVTGIYRCMIPDATFVDQNIYIGVYTASTGKWCICTEIN